MDFVIKVPKKDKKPSEGDDETKPAKKERKRPGTKKRLRGKAVGVTEKEVKRPRGGAAAEEEDLGRAKGSDAGKKRGKKNKTKTPEEEAFEEEDEGAGEGEEEETEGDNEQEEGDGEDEDGGRTPAKRAKDRGAAQVDDEEEGEESEESEEEETEDTQDRDSPQHDAPSDHTAESSDEEQEAGSVEVTATQQRRLPVLSRGGFSEARVKKLLKAVPGLACSTCTIGPECPEFKEGYVCAFRAAFSAFNMRDADGVLAAMGSIAQRNMERLQFAYTEEAIVSGGHPDPAVTALSETVMRQGKVLVDLDREVNSVKVTVTGTGRAGSVAAVATGAAAGRSILETMFAPTPAPALAPQSEVIEVSLHPDAAAEGAERVADTRGAEEERAQGGEDESAKVQTQETFDASQPAQG